MKGIIILSVILFAGGKIKTLKLVSLFSLSKYYFVSKKGALALPTNIESRVESKNRWALVPDNEGRMHLMDLDASELEPEPYFNAANDVFFVLYTRRNPTAGQRLAQTTASINNSQWSNGSSGTRFIIHGFNNNHQSPVNVVITRAFLAAADHNVVAVDWGAGANTINYVTARNRVPEVATRVAQFIDFLHQNGFLANFNRLVIAGHSLGAHIAGLTGKRVTRGRVQAIFGLDPAGPLFDMGNPGARFDSNDAIYTEKIATNAGTLGFWDPLANANFYRK